MQPVPVIAIFDIGKTNKKLFLFDEHYQIVHEETVKLPETTDEDGFPCENLKLLSSWVESTYWKLLQLKEFDIKAVNFSAYGASFVHLDSNSNPVTPLYNYLKPFPENLKVKFYETYGGEETVSLQTASPVLGNLNSGMQLYWLKHHQPEVYRQIDYSLHLPQYLSFLITGGKYADITSIGCHTGLWNFQKNDYHNWVYREDINEKLAPIVPSNTILPSVFPDAGYNVGIGLHDSSSALIPYLKSFQESFILISTGTWCISLNPFNQSPLTPEELEKDCLSYMSFEGKAVKASRLFAGNEHEVQTNRLAIHFCVAEDQYKQVAFHPEIIESLQPVDNTVLKVTELQKGDDPSVFASRSLNDFATYEEAYHQLILDIIAQQIASTGLVIKNAPIKRIFVDGGFSKNLIYMHLLASAFPQIEVYAASMAQASALGAALAMHDIWKHNEIPSDLIEVKCYSGSGISCSRNNTL